MSDAEDLAKAAKKKLFSKYKTKSYVGHSVSVDRNMIKVTNSISGKEEEFEDLVYVVKDITDRDFYLFTDNL